jgi:hypothetical protein
VSSLPSALKTKVPTLSSMSVFIDVSKYIRLISTSLNRVFP